MQTNKVSIKYCKGCRWLHRAAWLAQELLLTFENEIDEISIGPGETGEFLILLNQQIIFSRKQMQRFPEVKELKTILRDKIAPEKNLGHSEA